MRRLQPVLLLFSWGRLESFQAGTRRIHEFPTNLLRTYFSQS